MRYFLCLISHEPNGRPVEIAVLPSHTNAANIAMLPTAFNDASEAHRQREQLETLFGIPKRENAPTGRKQRVRCDDTGIVYESAAAAARAHHVSRSAVTQHLRHPLKYRSVSGVRFSYNLME